MKNKPSRDWLAHLKAACPDIELFPPGSGPVIAEVESAVGQLPSELSELLRHSNGLRCRSFHLFSAFDRKHYKKTWESLQRANDPKHADALDGDPSLLARFLVFADIGNGFAFWDRTDGAIWFNESHDQDLVQTKLSFREFVETMVENAE